MSHPRLSYKLERDPGAKRYRGGHPRTALLSTLDDKIRQHQVRISSDGDVLVSELRRLRIKEGTEVHHPMGPGAKRLATNRWWQR